ncbi:hypothetical protein CEXT_588551 [Caerostris extrusa]|uniref:Uncharacterized protein n=1 Tax=Caerostris extrusa TaxID=172846 RepID=A0AAV4UBE4_CAEEX|nr:hypothetical protein CEXT_588551 [Caerostris extrusa]
MVLFLNINQFLGSLPASIFFHERKTHLADGVFFCTCARCLFQLAISQLKQYFESPRSDDSSDILLLVRPAGIKAVLTAASAFRRSKFTHSHLSVEDRVTEA